MNLEAPQTPQHPSFPIFIYTLSPTHTPPTPPPTPSLPRHWSGAFPLPEREQYFGLKIRRRALEKSEIIIIPVSITVGVSGQILVTLKSDT
jgi:hypothetical protein